MPDIVLQEQGGAVHPLHAGICYFVIALQKGELLLTFRQIEYFIAIANCKNFTKAANRLYVSQPAISQQVSMMEQELGFPLFIRDKREVQLTATGEILYEAFSKMLKIYDEAYQEALQSLADQCELFRIGLLRGISLNSLPETLSNFFDSLPEEVMRIESLYFSELRRRLLDDSIDIAITFSLNIENDPEIKSKYLCEAPNFLAISQSHPLAQRSVLSVKDFENETFYLVSDKELPSARSYLYSVCANKGFSPRIIIDVPNSDTMRLMLESGKGAVLLDKLCHPWIFHSKNFRCLELNCGHQVVVAWKKSNTNSLISKLVALIP